MRWVPGWMEKPFTKVVALEGSRFESRKMGSALLIR